jgi:hypothetical protein
LQKQKKKTKKTTEYIMHKTTFLFCLFLLLTLQIFTTFSQLHLPGLDYQRDGGSGNYWWYSAGQNFRAGQQYMVTSVDYQRYGNVASLSDVALSQTALFRVDRGPSNILIPITLTVYFGNWWAPFSRSSGQVDVFAAIYGCTSIQRSCDNPRRLGVINVRTWQGLTGNVGGWYSFDAGKPFVTVNSANKLLGLSNVDQYTQISLDVFSRLRFSDPTITPNSLLFSSTEIADKFSFTVQVPNYSFNSDTLVGRQFRWVIGSLDSDLYLNGPDTTLPAPGSSVVIEIPASSFPQTTFLERFVIELQEVNKITGLTVRLPQIFVIVNQSHLDSMCSEVEIQINPASGEPWDDVPTTPIFQNGSCLIQDKTECPDGRTGAFCHIELRLQYNCLVTKVDDKLQKDVQFGDTLGSPRCFKDVLFHTNWAASSIELAGSDACSALSALSAGCFSLETHLPTALTSLSNAGVSQPIFDQGVAISNGVINAVFSVTSQIDPIYAPIITGVLVDTENSRRVPLAPVKTSAHTDGNYLALTSSFIQFLIPPLIYTRQARVELTITYPFYQSDGITQDNLVRTAISDEFSVLDLCKGRCDRENYQFCDTTQLSLSEILSGDFTKAVCRCSLPLIEQQSYNPDTNTPLICGAPCQCLNGGTCQYPPELLLPKSQQLFVPTPTAPVPLYSITTNPDTGRKPVVDNSVSYTSLIDQSKNIDLFSWIHSSTCQCDYIPHSTTIKATGKFCEWNIEGPEFCENRCSNGFLTTYQYVTDPLTGETSRRCPPDDNLDCTCFNNFGPSTKEWFLLNTTVSTPRPLQFCDKCSLESLCDLNNTHPVSFTPERCMLPNAGCICKEGYGGSTCLYNQLLFKGDLDAFKTISDLNNIPLDDETMSAGPQDVQRLTKINYFSLEHVQKTFLDNFQIDFGPELFDPTSPNHNFQHLEIRVYQYDGVSRQVVFELLYALKTDPGMDFASLSRPLAALFSHNSNFSSLQSFSLDDLYGQWSDLSTGNIKNDGTVTQITPECAYSSTYTPANPGSSQKVCPTSPVPPTGGIFDSEKEKSDKGRYDALTGLTFPPENSSTNLAVAIAVPVVLGVAFIAFLISLCVCKSKKVCCFKPKERRAKPRSDKSSGNTNPSNTNGTSTTGTSKKTKKNQTGDELSLATSELTQMNSTTGSMMSATANSHKSVVDPSLPAGWEAYENEHGKTYYIHQNSLKSQWNHPAPQARASITSAPVCENEYGW